MIRQGILRICSLYPETRVWVLKRQTSASAIQHDYKNVRPFEEIPGPKPSENNWTFIPGIGNLADLDFNIMSQELYKQYGKIVRVPGPPGRKDMVYLFDPQYIETVFRHQGPTPLRTNFETILKYRHEMRRDFFKGVEGALATQGKEWQNFRMSVNPAMMQPRNTKSYAGPIDSVAKELLERMKDLRDKNGQLPDDFINHMFRWALESICYIALDTRLGCLKPNNKPDSETEKLITAVQVVLKGMFTIDLPPYLIPSEREKLWKEMVESMDFFNELVMKYIKQAQNRIMQRPPDAQKDMSVLETLLIKNEDPMIACVMALDMFLGGVDTTANFSAKVSHFLSRNQDKQEILYEELKRILPSKDQQITANNLEDMKYLKACLKETARIAPITPANFRESHSDMVIGNYLIPKGVDLITGHRVLCNLEENFPEPQKFIPERWLKDSDQLQKAHPFVYLPFGFGARMCLGRRFAELETETLLANIFRNFRLQHDEELKENVHGLSTIANKLNFRLEERS
ncbi:probable cytochrome P450 49a1 isoform X1 [Anabrus simplex]|uniref:probable cytochrome P450 49a1 isoform X1 n=1 Tax=Anabrus simplex TaxID=316456 RepID=UPI0035A36CDF